MKSLIHAFRTLAFSCFALAFAQVSLAAGEFKGNWTIAPSRDARQVRFALMHHMHGGSSHHESDWPASSFQGLDLAARGKREVRFTITRDAGRFGCEGYLNGREGAGLFRFEPDANFVESMRGLGFTGIDDDQQFAMAVHDITLEFARAMKAEKLSRLDTDLLFAFRIHGVTPAFIGEIRSAGLTTNDSDKLVAFRIHGVTPEMVREVRKSGLTASDDQLIAMRIHGVTPEYIAQMKARGLKNLSVDQLVNLRIHGID
jgi:hypothetical protein